MAGLMGLTPEERQQYLDMGIDPSFVERPPGVVGTLGPMGGAQDGERLPLPPIPPKFGDVDQIGAPPWLRFRVGAQATPADQLRELRRYQPFATPLENDPTNFQYFDEATGKQTVYRPDGWRVPTFGDVASVMPEIAGGLLGTLGGIAAPAVSKNPWAAPAGFAAGDAAGQELARAAINRWIGGRDTRTAGQQALDMATTAAVDMAVPWAVQKVAPYAMAGVRAALPEASPVADAVTRLNAGAATDAAKIAPNLADVVDMPGVARVANAAQQFVGGGRISRKANEALDAMTVRANQLLETVAGAPDKVPDGSVLGQVVRDAATRANQLRLDGIEAARSDVVSRMGGPAAKVDMWPLVELEDQLAQRAAAEPEIARILQPALTEVRNVIRSGTGEMSLQNVLENRSIIGDAAFGRSEAGRSLAGKQREYMQQVYNALNDSLGEQAQRSGVGKEWAAYNTATSEQQGAGRLRQALEYYSDTKADPDKLRNGLMAELGGDQTRLAQLLGSMEPGDRSRVLAGLLRHMGAPTVGEARAAQSAAVPSGFSASAFGNRWAMVPPAARKTILDQLDPAAARSVEDLATVASGMRMTRDIAGKSPTAGAEYFKTAASMALTGAAGYPFGIHEAGALATPPAAWAAARAMTSPWVRDFMMQTPQQVQGAQHSLLGTVAGRGAALAAQPYAIGPRRSLLNY